MAYTKQTWTIASNLTAKALNYLETQWDSIKTDADTHNHDTRYYTQTVCKTRFFSTTWNYRTGSDADMLDGDHLSDILVTALPIGAIMMWSGTYLSVPDGWVVCDGSGGSPNLVDKFVIGASATKAVGTSGGASTHTLTGSISVAEHTVTSAEMPIHTHDYVDISNTKLQSHSSAMYADAPYGPDATISPNPTTAATGGGLGHGHTGSTISIPDVSIIPPYYAVYYIFKVS